MGCDIHVKTYLWSKVENRYIDLFEVLESHDIGSEHAEFPDIVGERHYDLFGAFGHDGRSYYPAMDCLHDGFPPFLMGSTLEKVLTETRSGYFGFVWCLLPELSKSIPRYNRALADPELYYRNDPETDQYLDYKDGLFTKEEFRKYNQNVINGLKEVRKRILKLKRAVRNSFWNRITRENLFDVEKTVFFVWFDS